MKQTCGTCAAFAGKDNTAWGECRAGPPQVLPINDGTSFRTEWPAVRADKWCLCHYILEEEETSFDD